MRIIKEGVKPKEKEKKCGYCKCHFTYSDSDIESAGMVVTWFAQAVKNSWQLDSLK